MRSSSFKGYRSAVCATVACLALVTAALAIPAKAGSPALTTGAGLSSSAAVVSSTATKTIVRSANLSTTGQNMWGGGAGRPTDAKLTLFNETWKESGPFGGIEKVCLEDLCTYYGAEFVGSVSGEIGMSIRLEGLGGGTLSVTYPVTVTFTAPADNSFDPGAAVDIKTSMVVDSANAKIVASFPKLNKVALDGVLTTKASLTGQVCFIACTARGNVFSPIDKTYAGEILGFNPSELSTCFTPLPLGFPWLLSTYMNPRCGENGYFFNPNVAVASTFNPADGTISATGQDKYAILPVNVLPGGGTSVFLGAASFDWTVFKAIITAIETMEQDLKFTPRVDVNLNWGKSLGFEVLNGVDNSPLPFPSGIGTNATFKVGDTLRLTTNSLNNKVIPITPTLLMGSATMSNHTRNASATEARLEALAFHVITYKANGTDVASNDGFGPVYSENFPVGTTRADIFKGSFAIGGFNSPVLESFNLVPRPIVEMRKNVVPANAPGLFNLNIDGQTIVPNVGDGGTTGRVVVQPGTRVISETAGTGGDLNLFDISITCVQSEGGAVHTQAAGASPGLGSSMDLVLTGGEDLICTVKNRLPAPSECDAMVFDNVIVGTPGNDTLKGTNKRDIIIGYGGDDTIESGSADDCVAGNAGNDRIALGAGNDVGDAGTGNDQIAAAAGNDIVYGGEGNDRLPAGPGDDLVYAGDGDDIVEGAEGVDNIVGGAGNDTMTGGSDSDSLDGGLGVDAAHGSSGIDVCIAETTTNCEF